ncbi:hypothetical protein BaRGS_00017904, partial [Batillaria attramentaria]
ITNTMRTQALILTSWICVILQDVHGLSIDKLLLRGIEDPNVMELQFDEASGVVSRDLDILFTFEQWGEIMERNKTRVPGARFKRKGSMANKLWPNAVVPYEISNYYSSLADFSGSLTDFPGSRSNFPGSPTNFLCRLPDFPGRLTDFPGSLTDFPGSRSNFPGSPTNFLCRLPDFPGRLTDFPASANSAKVRDALSNWEKDTCVRFRQATPSDNNKLVFTVGAACKSFLGMKTEGPQNLYLNEDCRTMEGVITHEVGHALGLYHEQSRPDRDQFVTINWDKIPEMMRGNFELFTEDVINTYGVPYDYKSIMHYGATAFSPSDEYTIIPKDPRFLQVIGNRESLSFRDIKIVNVMYKCGGAKPCVDDNSMCKSWATGDQCSKNPSYMHKYCRKSCAICGGSKPQVCKDANTECGKWARAGECERNPTYMKSFCKLSCRVCTNGINLAPTQSPCKDLNNNCQSWSLFGYCTNSRNAAYMRSNCKKSCGLCGG